jgi:hypothetical protein
METDLRTRLIRDREDPGALVVLFYVVTIAKMGPQVLQRPL